MQGTPARRSSAASWWRSARAAAAVARALRLAAIVVLAASASGTVPTLVVCTEQARGCGDKCLRCWCKRRTVTQGFRPICACCQPQPGAPAVTLLKAAVLPAPTAAPSPALNVDRVVWTTTDLHPIAAEVPHPPPRPIASA